MSIKMVRMPSETPNISNTDDFVGLRYAYGNQNGYVVNKGQECSYIINGSKFKINSGRLVLQGIECDIDASGVEITIDNVATKRYYTVYLQVNLALNETKILATFDTATYPNIDSGEDLTQNTTGVARIKLYQFDAINGVISNVQKTVNGVKYGYAENSKKVNGLEITRYENGVLKIGDIIIPQKMLIAKDLNIKNTPLTKDDQFIYMTIPNIVLNPGKHYLLEGYWDAGSFRTRFVYNLYTTVGEGIIDNKLEYPAESMNVIATVTGFSIADFATVNVKATNNGTNTKLQFTLANNNFTDETFISTSNSITLNSIYEIIE